MREQHCIILHTKLGKYNEGKDTANYCAERRSFEVRRKVSKAEETTWRFISSVQIESFTGTLISMQNVKIT